MKTALYVRVSTDHQAEKGYSVEAQTDKLKNYCQLQNIHNYDLYIDGGYSGSTLNRPQLKRLIKNIKQNKIDTVIIYKLDRLSRKTKDTLHIIDTLFAPNNIKFVSLNEAIDTTSPSGLFFLSVLSSVAQLERDTIRERSMTGRTKKAEKGIKSKTPSILFGYDFDNNSKQYTIIKHKAKLISEVFDKFISGQSITEIAKFMYNNFDNNHHNKNPNNNWIGHYLKQVWRTLQNPNYAGLLKVNGQLIPATNLPAIVPMPVWQQAQDAIKTRKKVRTKTHSKHLLSGLLFCGVCGASLRTYFSHNNKHNYYVCHSKGGNNPNMIKDSNCTLPYLNYTQLNAHIKQELIQLVAHQSSFEREQTTSSNYAEELQSIETEIASLNNNITKLVDTLSNDHTDRDLTNQELVKIKSQRDAAQLQASQLECKQMELVTTNYDQAKGIVQSLINSKPDEQRDLLKKLVQKIIVHSDKTTKIYWNF